MHRLGRGESRDRLHEHIHADREQQHRVRQCREDLEPVEPERAVRPVHGPIGQMDRREGHAQPDDVGELMARIGEQGQGVGGQRARHLDHEEGQLDP